VEDLQAALARLSDLAIPDLRVEWRRYHRSDPPPAMTRDFLVRAVAFALQERLHGRLSQTSRRALLRKVSEREGGAKGQASVLAPGIRLVRAWGGETHTVLVLEIGFDYRDKRYRSLTEIAKLITGAHWSGPRFFGLIKRAANPKPEAIATAQAEGPHAQA